MTIWKNRKTTFSPLHDSSLSLSEHLTVVPTPSCNYSQLRTSRHHEYLTSTHTHSLSSKRKYIQAHTKFSKIPTNFHITNIHKYSHTLIQIYTKTLEQLPTLNSHIYFIYILFILCPRCPQSVKEYMFMSKNKPFQITKLSSPFPVISLPGTSKPTDRNLTRAKSCVVWIHTA